METVRPVPKVEAAPDNIAADWPNASSRYRLWMLRILPDGRRGEWLGALVIFVVLLLAYAAGDQPDVPAHVFHWPAGLFFCATLAYIVPVFQFITRRTEQALDQLTPYLNLPSSDIAAARSAISTKTSGWMAANLGFAITFWLFQSWLLAGSWQSMMVAISSTFGGFLMAVGPLLVWITLTCACHALVDNARLFQSLARHLKLNLLDTRPVLPFGRMAVNSTLVVIGAQALFPLMWIGGTISWWSTVPGLVTTTGALVYLFVAPLWPVHRQLRQLKAAELARAQEELNERLATGEDNWAAKEDLAGLLAYRREINEIGEWPIDLSVIGRLLAYAVIVPLTWIGAALIEIVVDAFVG